MISDKGDPVMVGARVWECRDRGREGVVWIEVCVYISLGLSTTR